MQTATAQSSIIPERLLALFAANDLERIHPLLDCAVNRLLEREAARTVRDGLALAMPDRDRGLAILDTTLRVVQANRLARELCGRWEDGTTTGAADATAPWPLPSELLAVCQEIADRLGKTVHAVKCLLHRIYRRTGIPSRAGVVAAMRTRDPRPAGTASEGD